MFLPTFERRALWQAVSTRGSPPAPRFGKLPEFGASPSTWNGSQTAQLFYQGESWSFEPQMAVQPDEQAKPSFHSPESLPVPDAAGRAQARLPPPCSGSNPGNLLLCPWQDTHSTGTRSAPPLTYSHFSSFSPSFSNWFHYLPSEFLSVGP